MSLGMWKAALAVSSLLVLGACASSKAPEEAKAESKAPAETASGLDDNERKALLAIFANPGGAPAQATPATEPAASVPAQETPAQEAAVHDETASSEEAPSTRSAYDAWFGNGSAGGNDPSAAGPAERGPEPSPSAVSEVAPKAADAKSATASSHEESDPLAAPLAGTDEAAPPPPDAENLVGVLPPQRLAAGTCGMFLWVRKADAKLVFFSYGAEGAARMNIRDRIVDLKRVSVGGMTLFGQFEHQNFEAGTLRVDLTVDFARRTDLLDGAKVSQGRLRLVDESGWSYVLPVAGLIGCQTAEASEEG